MTTPATREQAAINRERRERLEAAALRALVARGRLYSTELADVLHLRATPRGRAYAAQLLVRMEGRGYATREWHRAPARNGSGRNYYAPTEKARAVVEAMREA